MADDPAFEREKWQAELGLRKRELALQEREQGNRDAELALKLQEHRAAAWRNPLIVALLAAAAAAAGNAVVAYLNGTTQRQLEEHKSNAELQLERSKAESGRILEMIKTGSIEGAAANLDFLLKSGLIADRALAPALRHYLDHRPPGTGPSLPSPSGRVTFEKSELLPESLQAALQAELTRYFAYLDRIGFPKPPAAVTVLVKAMQGPNAYYEAAKNRIVIDHRMTGDSSVALREYNHHVLLASRHGPAVSPHMAALESGLADYFACSFLGNPRIGEKVAQLFGREDAIRNLQNNKTYADFSSATDLYHEGAEIWGGLLWSLRQKLGAALADPLIFKAWTAPGGKVADAEVAAAFSAALKQAARGQPAVLAAVEQTIRERGFPSP